MDVTYNTLLDLNKTALHTKLKNQVQKIGDLHVTNDIIDALSNQKERDRRLVNDYTEDEIKTYTIKRTSGLKSVRMFTKKGLERYVHEGKLYDYANACRYFNIPPINQQTIEYNKFLESIESDKKYKTNSLLKWLFGKRKMCKALGEYCTIDEILGIFKESKDAITDHLEFLSKKEKENPN